MRKKILILVPIVLIIGLVVFRSFEKEYLIKIDLYSILGADVSTPNSVTPKLFEFIIGDIWHKCSIDNLDQLNYIEKYISDKEIGNINGMDTKAMCIMYYNTKIDTFYLDAFGGVFSKGEFGLVSRELPDYLESICKHPEDWDVTSKKYR